jgi:hypothetical protein
MSYQFNGHNLYYGYDFPMVYGELFIPQVADGLMLRLGRFISLPDIEAQLAPNNYMYSHSLTYAWDNYTNTDLQTTSRSIKTGFCRWAQRSAPRRRRGTGGSWSQIRSPMWFSPAIQCSRIRAPSHRSPSAYAGRATTAGTASMRSATLSMMAFGATTNMVPQNQL